MKNLLQGRMSHIELRCPQSIRRLARAVTAGVLLAGCVTELDTGETSQAGILNGILNGMYHPEGLTQYLSMECPLLQQRLMSTGNLAQPFPSQFSNEIAKPVCEKFMFYTAELMVPVGEQITLSVGNTQVASFAGALGLQHLVRQVYPQYTFAQHAFLPAYPIARKVVTQGYAALTNDITRRVSYRTNIPQLDASRAPGEDNWPREFLQLVPFTSAGLAAMASDPSFLARQPDFFNACDPHQINYDHAQVTDNAPLPPGYCPLPIVVHGNLPFSQEVVPGRSCRILDPDEVPPPGTFLSGDVIVPEGGCPMIYYSARKNKQDRIIYDDRARNTGNTKKEGCDVVGPSNLTNCNFNVVAPDKAPMPKAYLAYWVFNVEPIPAACGAGCGNGVQ